jgi:hypothetical protein
VRTLEQSHFSNDPALLPMPRFFFHVTDERRILTDVVGREFRNMAAVRKELNSYIRALRGSMSDVGIHRWSELAVVVLNEKNELIQKMGFDLVSK